MFNVTALRSYAKLGVNFQICDRVLIAEEIVNPASDFSWQSMHGLFGDHRSKLTKCIINMFTRKRTCSIDLPSKLPEFVNLTIRYCPPIGQVGFVEQQYKRHSAEFGLGPLAQSERHGKSSGAGSIDDKHEPDAPRTLLTRNEPISSSPAKSHKIRSTVLSGSATLFLSIFTPTVVK
ncbi:hypothetical protein AJ87_27420 [Rhizobium yanglingense]|nr:hypothetical protein AJ87_27420 [Rhizobium yanglingense]